MVGRRLRRAVVGSLLVAEVLVPVGVVGGGVAAAEVPDGTGGWGSVPGLGSPRTNGPVPRPVEPVGRPEGLVPSVATRVRERVDLRREFVRVWEHPGGVLETEFFDDRVAFDAGAGRFELVDATVHEARDAAGWLVSGANSWVARFGPSDVGVEVTLGKDRFSQRPGVGPGGVGARLGVAPGLSPREWWDFGERRSTRR